MEIRGQSYCGNDAAAACAEAQKRLTGRATTSGQIILFHTNTPLKATLQMRLR